MTATDKITKFTDAVIGDQAVMLLYDHIGLEFDRKTGMMTGIDAQWFAEEMYWHKNNGRHVTVKLNTPGGQVFAGLAIIDAIIECGADTHIVGMAASMGGVVAQFGARRLANDFSVLMIHKVSGEAKTKGDKQLMEIVRQQLVDCLTKRSKLTAEQVTKLVDSGDDNWYDSSAMLEKGLVDEVIATGVKVEKKISSKVVGNSTETFKVYTQLVNSLSTTAKNTKKMEENLKTIGAALKIENADESKIIAAFQEQASEKSSLTEKVTKLENELKAFKDKAEADLKTRATKLVEESIKAGKVEESAKQSWIDMAIVNFDAAEKSLAGMKGAFKSVASALEDNKDTKTEVNENTYEDLAKNNPAKLKNILENDPELYDKIEKLHLNKQAK